MSIFAKELSAQQPSKRSAIVAHPLFCSQMEQINQLEKDRIFCKHNLSHLLDVCRLMQLETITAGFSFSTDLLYGAGLLHDIGRTEGEHHLASAKFANQILLDCGYSQEECSQITDAILKHRQPPTTFDDLAALLYRADKASRPCYCCKASTLCNWPKEKRNQQLCY